MSFDYEPDERFAFVRTQLSAVPCWEWCGETCGSFPHGIRVPKHLPAHARAAWLGYVVAKLHRLNQANGKQ